MLKQQTMIEPRDEAFERTFKLDKRSWQFKHGVRQLLRTDIVRGAQSKKKAMRRRQVKSNDLKPKSLLPFKVVCGSCERRGFCRAL